MKDEERLIWPKKKKNGKDYRTKRKQKVDRWQGIVSKIDSKSKLKPTRWAVQREFQETIFNGSKCKMTH